MPVDPCGIEGFPIQSTDKLRYCDCDPQGHINNSVFSTFLETGRTEFLYTGSHPFVDKGCGLVIARLEMDFIAELHWPGSVVIGSRVLKVGNSSITLDQAVFQDDVLAARAKTVLVQMDQAIRKPRPLSEQARERLTASKG
ncbi:acyl-CoA thioesterase [Roseibium algae]|uniref:Thioesterase family protein n=1 Tax=Roseibium algae TaxID=3123038 RepID=A0ABU8TRK6_9HYPH